MQPLPYHHKLSPSPRIASLGSLAGPGSSRFDDIFGARPGPGRTVSLSSGRNERGAGQRRERHYHRAEERDLRLVEDDCRRRIESCNRHEKAIKLLRREIEEDVQEWDSLLDTLAEADHSAQILADQIQSSLSNLRQTSQPQLASARRELAEAHERVQVTNKDIKESDAVIRQAHSMVSVIEARIKAERLVQSKMSEYNTIGFWLIGLGLFGVAIGFFCLLVPVKLIVRLLASKAKTTVRTGLDRWAAEL